jgi:ABC-type transporter Mla maintaining outer membrane lipid asymmetry ATPase subunit MlaF
VTPVLALTGIHKAYQSLRPLRLQALTLEAGERVAISGLDAGAAEVLVNLITGASLPDQGEVRVLGQSTADISDGDAWLASLDRFGIVSPRGVLLEGATVAQNLAMPFSLQIDPIEPDVAEKVSSIAAAVGLATTEGVTGEAAPEIRARMHLARAIALEPQILVLEHPTIALPESGRASYAADIVRVTDARRLATLIITQDDEFARIVAQRALRLEPATGALKPIRRGWFR